MHTSSVELHHTFRVFRKVYNYYQAMSLTISAFTRLD